MPLQERLIDCPRDLRLAGTRALEELVRRRQCRLGHQLCVLLSLVLFPAILRPCLLPLLSLRRLRLSRPRRCLRYLHVVPDESCNVQRRLECRVEHP